MELASLSENIVFEKFARNGESVELQINIDAVTPEFFEHLDLALRRAGKQVETMLKARGKKKKPGSDFALEKNLLILQRDVYASFLTDPIHLPTGGTTTLLRGWDLTDNGEPVECNKATLIRLPPKAVEALCEFCIHRAKTVKKRVDEEIEETSGSIQDGSPVLRVVGQNT